MSHSHTPNADFFIRMKGDAMQEAGINNNDLLRVRATNLAQEGDIVLALVEQDLIIRRFFKDKNRIILMADNVNFPSMVIQQFEPFEVCGVVELKQLQ